MPCARCGGETSERPVRVRPWVITALLVSAVVASWVILAPAFHDLIEGVERGALLGWKLAVAPALLAAAVAAWSVRVRRPVCAACGAVASGWLLAPVRAVPGVAMP